ncbi:hypothetical protein [Xenophilus sp. Marseille-Q4582]|uniref:hypothetical protein n=1 Tax=Xenophilus sp. Marseille-Q4582 TaxID=2866600 RepID=UPI001CE3DE45|nr:hypothetical protein [Xenophilus sp. Marseille-Q4582]
MTSSALRPPRRPASRAALRLAAVATLGAALLSGCYVVPMQPGQALPPGPVTVVPAQQAGAGAPTAAPAPAAQHFSARLYPSNAEAARYGTLTGAVSNDMNGRGHFSAVIDGEHFQGEATRAAGSPRSGVAHAAGTRGGMLACRYTMNSATQGAGSCVLNNGPTFAMHLGA